MSIFHDLRLPAILLCAGLLTSCSQASTAAVSRDLFAMDTYMQLQAYGPEKALDEAEARIQELEQDFSVTRPDSSISRINAAAGVPVTVEEDTVKLLHAALAMGKESGGALDITLYPLLAEWGFTKEEKHVPPPQTIAALLDKVDYAAVSVTDDTVQLPAGMMLDLGAAAKGYTGDAVMEIFRENGIASAVISLGGNVQTLGRKPDGTLWKVGITDPFSPSETCCTIEVENKAVITSGTYERYFEEDGQRWWHILDPADGYPADNGLISVTVIGDSGTECDLLSTALFVEGTEKAAEHWREREDFEMICVTEDGKLLVTEGIADSFTNQSAMPMEVLTRE